MPFCKNCGAKLEDNDKFCTYCGAEQAVEARTETEAQHVKTTVIVDAPAKASGKLNVGSLVWSIINLVLCCMPVALAALITTILAKDAPSAEEEAKKLKTARICNIVSTAGGAVLTFLYIALMIIGMMMGEQPT